MEISLERIVWVVLSLLSSCVTGVCLYFIKRLVDKTEKTIDQVTILNARMSELTRMEKRLDAMEALTSNLSSMVSAEFARLNESLRWMKNRR